MRHLPTSQSSTGKEAQQEGATARGTGQGSTHTQHSHTTHSHIHSKGHPPVTLSLVMPVPLIATIPAGVAAAVGKGAATIGGSVIGGVATYAIVDAAKGNQEPQIHTAILSSAANNDSDSLLAVNFGGTESGIIIVSIILIAALIIFKCCKACRYKCCKKPSSKQLQRAALLSLASVVSQTNQDAINNQPQDSKKAKPEMPEAIIVEKEPGQKYTGNGVKEECAKSGNVVSLHTSTKPRNTSSPLPPPPYPSEPLQEEENMELCTAIYSQIGDVNIINIP